MGTRDDLHAQTRQREGSGGGG
ncbi:hypothetical protein STRTUCAR8_07561, partial [Streptomyces turgidiscabies Car8]